MVVANELLFRAIFAILWILFLANIAWVRFSLREPRGKRLNNSTAHGEHWFHIAAMALFAPFWFGGIILYILVPGWISFLSFPLPDWFRYLMAGIAAISIPFII